MKNGFRQSMSWLHIWAGLVFGWVLYFMFLTGTLGYLDTEIDRWMQPELPAQDQTLSDLALMQTAFTALQGLAPQAESWFVAMPVDRNEPWLRASWRMRAEPGLRPAGGEVRLDARTGQVLQGRETGGGQWLYRLHWRLHYLPSGVYEWIVGLATLVMLVTIVTGVIVHKKIFADFFTFRPGKGQRSWLDGHNLLAVLALPFHLMITYTGLIFAVYLYMSPVIMASYGQGMASLSRFFEEFYGEHHHSGPIGMARPFAPLAPMLAEVARITGGGRVYYIDVHDPGDANARIGITAGSQLPSRQKIGLEFDGERGALLEISAPRSTVKVIGDSMMSVHEALFAGPLLRALFLFCGVAGTAMIGTGLVLWTVKRREKLKKRGGAHAWPWTVERLNVATVMGLPVAICAYFWANRLLPLDLPGRAAWEQHALFLAWLAMLGHALLRGPAAAWREQAGLAGLAFLLLPLLNALTTDRHLGHSIPAGDWVMAGMDLGFLAVGLCFLWLAGHLTRHAESNARVAIPLGAE